MCVTGVADWVYEEEVLSETKAVYFSPDGAKIAWIGKHQFRNEIEFYFVWWSPLLINRHIRRVVKTNITI